MQHVNVTVIQRVDQVLAELQMWTMIIMKLWKVSNIHTYIRYE